MSGARTVRLVLAGAFLTTLAAGVPQARAATPAPGPQDATVIAVIDGSFTPYHWDFLASKMPQALDGDPSNDLPLGQPPDTWLPGFPLPATFASYNRFDLTLDEVNPNRTLASLDSADATNWSFVRRSTPAVTHYYWFPGTKVIGGLTFSTGKIHAGGTSPGTSHGTGTSSVSVGNLFGTCPECLLVFIQYGSAADGEAAIEWAMSQPWIDAVTNSYGFSLVQRDRLYSGSNTEAQRTASARGQTVFFSAGNGITNTFIVPNSTLFSSQEGPDWIVTVGAISPSGYTYSGAGKPADVAGIGSGYPSAYTATVVGKKGATGFSGTSNATPTVAGMYGRALGTARVALAGTSRVQSGGVVASGQAYVCGAARPDCELGDGTLTAKELRTRLFHGAVHTPGGLNPGGVIGLSPVGEDEFLGEGHGSYFARLNGTAQWLAEADRIIGPLEGASLPVARPAGEAEWMTVDSFCRQHLWGSWSDGYYVAGSTALPGPDATYPLRSTIETTCPALFPPV